MQVEVFSDVVCPWCYIGKRRFFAALERFEHAADVDVRFRSFQLDPDAAVGSAVPQVEALAAKYGRTVEQARAMNERVGEVARGVGLEFHLDRAWPANTFDAHRLLHLAADRGRQPELVERLFSAYFCDGARLDDRAELVRLAGEVEIPADAADGVLAGDRYADAVRDDLELAASFGISAVPFFVLDRTYGVAGAQETTTLVAALREAWDARAADRPSEARDGEVPAGR